MQPEPTKIPGDEVPPEPAQKPNDEVLPEPAQKPNDEVLPEPTQIPGDEVPPEPTKIPGDEVPPEPPLPKQDSMKGPEASKIPSTAEPAASASLPDEGRLSVVLGAAQLHFRPLKS